MPGSVGGRGGQPPRPTRPRLPAAPFPHPARRTGQADFPHPALGQGLTRSLTRSCASDPPGGSGPEFGGGTCRETVTSLDPPPGASDTGVDPTVILVANFISRSPLEL